MGKTMMGGKRRLGNRGKRFLAVVVVVASIFGLGDGARAFKIDTGNEDIKVNWDNTFRYNLGYRMGSQDQAILANPNLDDGDRNFASGFVANRLDVLSEVDFVFKRDFGFRVSWAGWYDQAYAKDSFDNNSLATSNHLKNGVQSLGVSDYVKYYYAGPSGEVLDAFGFGNFSIGDVPVQIKAGRHTLYFGESLGLTAGLNSIAYVQSPIDFFKGYAVPGTGLKELFRPLNSISASVSPLQGLSITGQYFLQWEPARYPEAGSYLGIYDFFLNGAESLLDPALGVVQRGADISPPDARDWGLSMRWSPEWLFGTLGFYYRNLSDKLPQAHLNLNPLVNGSSAAYNFAYADNIDLFGISLSKQILGVSVGAELSYRKNMPLQSDVVLVASADNAAALGLPPGSYVTALPDSGDTAGARGDTVHGVLNFLGLVNKTPVFDTATWTVEFSWCRWDNVTQNEAVFKGRPTYTPIDRVSKDAFGVDATFIPTWFQVFPSVDLLAPMTFGVGLSGNGATVAGINEGAGYYSFGIAADIMSRYRVDLAYYGYFGNYETDPTGAVSFNNGDYALLKDRGTLALTFRATF
jgi:hypothetical protein